MERISALPKNRRKQWVNEGRMARLFAIMINNSLQNIWLHLFRILQTSKFLLLFGIIHASFIQSFLFIQKQWNSFYIQFQF